MSDALTTVTDFLAEWGKGKDPHFAAYRRYFRDDTIWETVGLATTTGVTEALAFLQASGAATVDVEMVKVAVAGDTVLTERVDYIRDGDGGLMATVKVMGTFEIEDGKIARWRDYFDTAPWLAASAGTAPAGKASKEVFDEIAAVTEGIVKGFITRDMDLIMSCYSDNEDMEVFDVAPPIKYVGAKTLRALNQHWLDTFTGEIDGHYYDLNVWAVGDVAWGSNVQHWTFTRPDGTAFEFNTRLTDVYRKIDGRWRVVLEHGSVPVDLATQQPVLDAK